MKYPNTRMRRLRQSEAMRRLVSSVRLGVDDLMYPLFVKSGEGIKQPVESMKDCFYFSADTVVAEAKEVAGLGIPAVLLFGGTKEKDELGSGAWAADGAVQQAVAAIKREVPELAVFTDVCLCAYTSHGHCGVLKEAKIDNDKSCELLAKMALSHAQAGADGVAPSDMMDGRVGVIRETLECNGFEDVVIMSYAAKYASAFYGPFRDVADSTPTFGDRSTYQMEPAADEAMAEIQMDIDEGADIVMVKPALCYLDVVARARGRFDVPIAAYNVSGEYMMINAAAERGLIDGQAAMMESLTSIKRAGADIIITYFAEKAAKLLRG